MSDAEQKRAETVRNERTKLTATWLNNVGVGCVIAGFLAPSLQAMASGSVQGIWALAGFTSWLFMGIALHFMGRAILTRLR